MEQEQERDLAGRLVEGIEVMGLTPQRAGETAEAIEDLLAAIEDGAMSILAGDSVEAMSVLQDAAHPYKESLLNDLIDALRAVERGYRIDVVKQKKPRY